MPSWSLTQSRGLQQKKQQNEASRNVMGLAGAAKHCFGACLAPEPRGATLPEPAQEADGHPEGLKLPAAGKQVAKEKLTLCQRHLQVPGAAQAQPHRLHAPEGEAAALGAASTAELRRLQTLTELCRARGWSEGRRREMRTGINYSQADRTRTCHKWKKIEKRSQPSVVIKGERLSPGEGLGAGPAGAPPEEDGLGAEVS